MSTLRVPVPSKIEEPARVQRPRRAAPEGAVRPTRAEINLGHLRHNLRVVQRAAGSARAWGVLKADAYGHGAPAVARTLERAGVDGLCVALLEEGIELRDAGIRCPILVMGGYYGQAWGELLARDLIPVLYEARHAEEVAREVRYWNRPPARVHLKVDTGMGRLGCTPQEVPGMLELLRGLPEIRLEGLMTHLACADAPDPAATREQLRRFEQVSAQVSAMGFDVRVRHAANSAAMLRTDVPTLDMVRPGIALFGITPFGPALPRDATAVDLRPVMKIRTEIVSLRDIPRGESIGYGWTFRADRPSRIATIPMGYADGLSRQLSNRGAVLIRGKRAPIVGTVSMDLTMVDVTDLEGARVRDEAVIVGTQQGELGMGEILAGEIAEQTGTIPWDVLTGVSRRVPRFYREP